MKIAVLGAGKVGGSLAQALLGCGHDVTLGVRNPDSGSVRQALDETAQMGINLRVMSIAEAVAASEVIALTIPWPAAAEVLTGIEDWSGKIIIDATNRFAPPSEGGAASAGEDVARLAAGSRVVKAFNTIGAEHYVDPMFGGERASMLIAGDDAAAKRIAASLIEEMGFEPIDAGPLANSALLENLARLWVSLARGGLGREIAFRVIKK